MILPDFEAERGKSCFRVTALGQDAELLAKLNGLGAAAGTQLVEGPATVGFDSVLANEEAVGDLSIAETLSDEVENLELARGDTQSVELHLVMRKRSWRLGRYEDLAQEDLFAGFG